MEQNYSEQIISTPSQSQEWLKEHGASLANFSPVLERKI